MTVCDTMKFCGKWSALQNYTRGQMVNASDVLYVCTHPSLNDEPPDLTHWRPAGGGGSADPATLSRLAIFTTAPPTGNASNAIAVISFPASPFDSTYENIGSDLEIDGIDDTKVNILTAGLYSLFVMAIIQSTELTFGDVNVGSFDPFTGIGLGFSMTDGGAGQWASIFSETYYVPAPTSVQFSIHAITGDASTWDVNSVDVRIQRIA
jgi:hypothetical protein